MTITEHIRARIRELADAERTSPPQVAQVARLWRQELCGILRQMQLEGLHRDAAAIRGRWVPVTDRLPVEGDLITLDRLRELVEADRDGRVVVLPEWPISTAAAKSQRWQLCGVDWNEKTVTLVDTKVHQALAGKENLQ